MAQFVAKAPGVEVLGDAILSTVEAMGGFRETALRILRENGVEDPQRGQWYRQQAWLDAFKQISESIGKNTLYLIGTKIPESAVFPPDIQTIHQALAGIDVAYHMNHRGGEIGTYTYKETGEQSGTFVCDNPYPDEFDRGIIEAMAKRFKPADSIRVKVEQDESVSSRGKGAESTTYHVSW